MTGSTADRIAAVAREILVAEGSTAVTMRRVATEVGVTPMAIYRHYPNRETLLAGVAAAVIAELDERWQTLAPADRSDLPTRTLCDRLLDDCLDFALGHPGLYAFLFTEPRQGASGSPIVDALVPLLERGMAERVFRQDDVRELALLLSATLHGLIQLHDSGRIGLPETGFRQLCQNTMGRVLDGIGR